MMSNRVLIVAELSANHGGDIKIAKETIKAAKLAGADAIKIQTYTADTLTIDSNKEYFLIDSGTIWDGRKLYDLYKEAYMPWEWTGILKDYSDEIGIEFFSTPFDKSAVDYLKKYDLPYYKIASFEITDIPLIRYIAKQGKPLIISTGIGTLAEIEDAVNACRLEGNNDIYLLKCTSQYPAEVKDANLNTMLDLKRRFNVEVGVSDHSEGWIVPVAAAALGAKIIEKHFILDKSIGGADASFSMEPDEFKNMVNLIREVELSLGEISYELTDKKISSRKFARSLFIVEDVRQGQVVDEKNVRSIRPGMGLEPKNYDLVLGMKFKSNFEKGTPLQMKMLEE
ncbi:MAG: pseudaminic acid synthase [Acidaminobacteraceae bacterium]